MLLFRELARRHGLELKPISAERRVRPGPDHVRVLGRGAARHLGAPGRPGGAAQAPGRAAPGRAARAGPAVRRRWACAGPASSAAPLPVPRPARSPCSMAKDQDLPMNPGRITGLCGRLRCCLAFEHPMYRSFRDRAPAVGTDGGDTRWKGYRAQLRGAERRMRRRDRRKDDDGGQARRDGRGGGMSISSPSGAPATTRARTRSRTRCARSGRRRGYEFVEGTIRAPRCVFNFVDPGRPQPFRRRQRSTYVIASTLSQTRRRRAAVRVPAARARARQPGACWSSPATPATS